MSKPPAYPLVMPVLDTGIHVLKKILIFDSGLGGLSVFTEISKAMPQAVLHYVYDDKVFPYGDLSESVLIARVLELMDEHIPKLAPDVVVIACNTASTLVLPVLRAKFNVPFVGTVPAIKPAAERSKSRMFSVLATPGTVARDYTHDLIRKFASNCEVTLVGAKNLAKIAEEYLTQDINLSDYSLLPFWEKVSKGRMRGISPDSIVTQIRTEIAPAFIEKNSTRTDIVVLACTHYPLILPLLQQAAPWQVDWINPAEAIARRVFDVLLPPTYQEEKL